MTQIQSGVLDHQLVRVLVREPDCGGNTRGSCPGGDVPDDHGAGADLHPVTDVRRAGNARSGADRDVVADRWVALDVVHRAAAEGHPVVDQHVVADLGGLADDHAHAVVDEEAPADLSAGVDLDTGDRPCDLREHSR